MPANTPKKNGAQNQGDLSPRVRSLSPGWCCPRAAGLRKRRGAGGGGQGVAQLKTAGTGTMTPGESTNPPKFKCDLVYRFLQDRFKVL